MLFDLAQNLTGGLQDGLAGRGHMGQVFAAAGENLHAQFILQQADLLADAGLRGVQALGGRRHIEIVVRHFPDVAQLLKLHAILRNRGSPGDGALVTVLMQNSH